MCLSPFRSFEVLEYVNQYLLPVDGKKRHFLKNLFKNMTARVTVKPEPNQLTDIVVFEDEKPPLVSFFKSETSLKKTRKRVKPEQPTDKEKRREERKKQEEEKKKAKEEKKQQKQAEKERQVKLQQEKKKRKDEQKARKLSQKRRKLDQQYDIEKIFQATLYSPNSPTVDFLSRPGLASLPMLPSDAATCLPEPIASDMPAWRDGVVICNCTLCQHKKYPAFRPQNPRDYANLPKATSFDFHTIKLPVLQLPCDTFSRDGKYRLTLMHMDSASGQRTFKQKENKSAKARTYVRFASVPSNEKLYLQGPLSEPHEYYVYSSVTMAAKRARKRFTNGWDYFEVLLQHDGFVFRVLLKYFRMEDGGQGFGQGNHSYTEKELSMLFEASKVTNQQCHIIETEMPEYLKTHYVTPLVSALVPPCAEIGAPSLPPPPLPALTLS